MDCTSINGLRRRKRRNCARPARGLGGSVGLGLATALLVLGFGTLTPGGPGLALRAAYGQDFAAAGQHFASAQDAFAQGQFELAAKEFQAAYDITRDPAMLLNIGESWQRAGNGKKALDGYRAYLAAQPQAPDRAEVEGRIQAIESALAGPGPAGPGGTAGATGPAGTPGSGTPADGQPGAAKSPTAGAPGTADAAGSPTTGPAPVLTPASPPVGKPEGDKPPAPESKATADKAAAGAQPQITPPDRPASRLRTAAWVTVALAIALGTSGAIVGLGAQDRADELRRRTTLLVGTQPPIYDAGQAEAYTTLTSEGNAYNQAAIALLSTAGAVAVTAGVLFIVDHLRRPKAEPKKGGWAIVPSFGPSLGPAPGLAAGPRGLTAGALIGGGGLVARGSF